MKTFLNKFRKDEAGAVTVDFVLVTAGLVVMAIAVGSSIASGAIDIAERQGKSLEDRPLGTDWYQP